MVKKSKIVAVVATLLIAAAGVITIQSCKKDKPNDITISNDIDNRELLAVYDNTTETMTQLINIEKLQQKINVYRNSSDRFVIESVLILDSAPCDSTVYPELKISILDTETESSYNIWHMKKYIEKSVKNDRTEYYTDKSVLSGNYTFGYTWDGRYYTVNVNPNGFTTNEIDQSQIEMLPRWTLVCLSVNCTNACVKSGSFWNAHCESCTPPGQCNESVAPWVVPTITILGGIIIALL